MLSILILMAACTTTTPVEGEDPPTTVERIEDARDVLDAVEEFGCGLQLGRNLDSAVGNVFRNIPFFGQWENVCPPLAIPDA